MFEKRFAAVPAQVFTANGGAQGSVSIADTSLFKVKQQVVITATGQANLELEVKKVLSSTNMVVGPIAGNINATTDLTTYTTAASAQIFANEQRRPTIISDDFERAVYEEEPTVAKRVILVDENGNRISDSNPLPTSASVAVGSVDQGAPNTDPNAWPVKVTLPVSVSNFPATQPISATSLPLPTGAAQDSTLTNGSQLTKITDGSTTVGITDVSGAKALKVDVIKTVGPTLTDPWATYDGFKAKTVAYFYSGNNIDRIETTIGTKKRIEQFGYTLNKLTSLTVTIVDV